MASVARNSADFDLYHHRGPFACFYMRLSYPPTPFTMRRGLLIFLVANLIILSFLVRSVFTLLSLLVEDASADAIHRAELPSPNSSLIEQRPQVIPKIIHQTYKNESVPEVWKDAQQSCIDLHPDYEYIVSCAILNPYIAQCHVQILTFSGNSSGQTKRPVTSSRRNTPGSWIRSMDTSIPFSARTRSGTLFWHTTVEPTLTLMMYVV